MSASARNYVYRVIANGQNKREPVLSKADIDASKKRIEKYLPKKDKNGAND